jgi:hypothetical protein
MTEALTTVFLLLATLIALCLGGQAETMMFRNEVLLAPPPAQMCPEKETEL